MFFGIELAADRVTRAPLPVEARLTERIVAGAFQKGRVLIAGMPGCADAVRGGQFQISPALAMMQSDIDRAMQVTEVAIRESVGQVASDLGLRY